MIKKLLLVLFGCAASFGVGSVLWEAAGGADVTTVFEEKVDPNAPKPIVEYVDYPDHEFGTMDLEAEGSYTFRIGNTGNAPLKLKEGPSSCQCTLSNLINDTIPPGEVGEVELKWKTEEVGEFAQGVTIWTNDPKDPAIVLRVTGEVQQAIGIEPHELVYPHTDPSESPTGTFTVYSFADKNTHIERTSDAKSNWIKSIEPVAQQELEENDALAGYRVTFQLPAEQEAGYFVHQIPVALVTETAGGATRRIEQLTVRGTIRSSFVVFGSKIRSNGRLAIGKLLNQQGAEAEFTVVLRDADDSIGVQGIESPLPWLEFNATRSEDSAEGEVAFNVKITVPKNAPVCAHFGDAACPIDIKTNHRRVPVLRVLAEFAVLSPGVKLGVHD